MQKKLILEKIEYCKALLERKLLKEASTGLFDKMVAVGRELMDTVADSEVLSNLEDDVPLEISKVEVNDLPSEEDFNSDGTMTEDAKRRRELKAKRSLSENKLNERTQNQLVADFKAEGNERDHEAYKNWFMQQPEYNEGKKILNGYNFKKLYDAEVSVVSSKSSRREDDDVVSTPYVKSAELKALEDLCGGSDAMNQVISIAESVEDKYNEIEMYTKAIANRKVPKRYFILAGDPGIGKTYEVQKALKEIGKYDTTPYKTGAVGSSKTAIYLFLWQYRECPLLILDDCDDLIRAKSVGEAAGILKGAMEAQTNYMVGLQDLGMRKRLGKMMEEMGKIEGLVAADSDGDAVFESVEDPKYSYITKDLVEAVLRGEISDEDLDEMEEECAGTLNEAEEAFAGVNGAAGDSKYLLPEEWQFNARVIFISNAQEYELEEALKSRCLCSFLNLTHEEFLVRLAAIIDGMDIGQKEGYFTEEDVRDAKALTMSVIKPLIEAGEHGQRMFGKIVRLQDHFQFRLVKDICSDWLTMLSFAMEKNPGKDPKTIRDETIPKWVRACAIPRLSVSARALKGKK